MRYVEPGQSAEIAFKMYPGKVYNATVESIAPGSAQGQVAPSGLLLSAVPEDRARETALKGHSFVHTCRLDD